MQGRVRGGGHSGLPSCVAASAAGRADRCGSSPTSTDGGQLTCGRTARNNPLMEVLVSHQTLSTPKIGYNEQYPSGTPQGRTQKIHIFPQGSNNKNELQYLIHFIHPEFLEVIITIPNVRVRNIKQRNDNKHLSRKNRDLFVPTRRILHTTATPQAVSATWLNKP